MRFSLLPRATKFFDLFDEAAALVSAAAEHFLALVTQFDRLPERTAQIRDVEHRCDEVVGRIIQALDRSFITPFDREDIHTLASLLDDVLDNIEETAFRFEAFRIDRPTPAAVTLAGMIRDSCTHLEQAIRLCRTLNKAEAIQQHVRAVSALENEADGIYRASESGLFAAPPEVLQLIKWRELYSWLEQTADSCKKVAHVIAEIVIKGS